MPFVTAPSLRNRVHTLSELVCGEQRDNDGIIPVVFLDHDADEITALIGLQRQQNDPGSALYLQTLERGFC